MRSHGADTIEWHIKHTVSACGLNVVHDARQNKKKCTHAFDHRSQIKITPTNPALSSFEYSFELDDDQIRYHSHDIAVQRMQLQGDDRCHGGSRLHTVQLG